MQQWVVTNIYADDRRCLETTRHSRHTDVAVNRLLNQRWLLMVDKKGTLSQGMETVYFFILLCFIIVGWLEKTGNVVNDLDFLLIYIFLILAYY